MLEAFQENTRYKSASKENAKFLSKAFTELMLHIHDRDNALPLLAAYGARSFRLR